MICQQIFRSSLGSQNLSRNTARTVPGGVILKVVSQLHRTERGKKGGIVLFVLEAIQEAYPNLSKSKQRLAEYLTEHWQEAAFWPAGTLARRVGLSESLVVRFAQDLGYAGYKQIQQDLQALVRQRLPMASKLEASSTAQGTDSETVAATIQNDIDNLTAVVEQTTPGTFTQVAEAIVQARQVMVVGTGHSGAMAHLMANMLNLITGNAFVPATGPAMPFAGVARATPEDLVICISFPRYMRSTIQAGEVAKEQKARVVAITDGMLSPLARLADHAILVRNRGLSFAESHAATVGAINVLTNLVGRRAAGSHRTGLARLEEIYERYGLLE
ncbi:MAG: transcriptional regulator, RpiR family [Firmicutes bacterium]|nr:transcriptional regulator, RpiR family [Bacillota bacterium]